MTEPRPLRITVAAEAPLGHITLAGLDFGGSGPLLLLCHANGLAAATWGLVAEQLTDDYRVVELDARGHGDSDAPPPAAHLHWRFLIRDLAGAAEALRQRIGQPIAAAVGASMGGVVANAVAAEYPGLFGRLIMFDPPVMPPADIRRELGMPEETGNSRMGAQARRRRRDWPSRDDVSAAWRDKPMFAAWPEAAFNLYLDACFRATEFGVTLKCAPETEATVFERTADVDT
ncbi:MAG: alpha/beta fold hydrolase, partial [Gammaproteobacteria bacterium]